MMSERKRERKKNIHRERVSVCVLERREQGRKGREREERERKERERMERERMERERVSE